MAEASCTPELQSTGSQHGEAPDDQTVPLSLRDESSTVLSTRPSSPFAAPRLEPSSPRGISTVSSLNMSLEVDPTETHTSSHPSAEDAQAPQPDYAGQEPIALEVQTLMQMLSLVGSRLWEADQLGLEPALSDADNDAGESTAADDEDSLESSSELPRREPVTFAPDTTGLTNPALTRRLGVKSHVFDEQTTPRGGRTPLAASMQHSGGRMMERLRPSFRQRQDKPEEIPAPDSSADSSPSSSASSGDESEEETGAPLASASQQLEVDVSQRIGSVVLGDTSHNASVGADDLSHRIQSMFGLPPSERVESSYPCWLFRSILLQGTMFLTSGHVLFYAYLPSKGDKVVKAGSIRKRTQKTYRFSRHWAILRGRALSWYDSQRDPYFPQDHIDLRDVMATTPSTKHPRHFKVQTPYRTFVFGVESEEGRDEWVSAIQRAAFRAQNAGESVRVSIPLEAIVDVESAANPEHSDTVSLQVVDTEADDFALDEYYFLHFARHEDFVTALKGRIQEQLAQAAMSKRSSASSIRDSTESVRASAPDGVLARGGIPEIRAIDPRVDLERRPKEARIDAPGAGAPATAIEIKRPSDRARNSFEMAPPSEASPDVAYSVTPRAHTSVLDSMLSAGDGVVYPPHAASGQPPASLMTEQASRVIPGWVKHVPSRLLNGSPTLYSLIGRRKGRIRPIKEVWSSPLKQHSESAVMTEKDCASSRDLSDSQASAFSMVEAAGGDDDSQAESGTVDVRRLFSLSSEDRVLRQVGATLYRVLPVSGTLYITTRHLCFYAASLATKAVGRTKMILPFTEVISCVKHSAFRFGQHGLVLTIRGHEELFLEFPSRERRDQCLSHVEEQIEIYRGGNNVPPIGAASLRERADAVVLTDLSRDRETGNAGMSRTPSAEELPSPSASQRFEDTSLLSLRPHKPLHFTILTIGSRGDVQPFVALAKGLVDEGHRVRLATHAEFGPWIEQHGVEFREIGGDPAELMRICVENGTFTLSFFREGVTKFRGWLDDLLVSCWEACQGTDVIIENPNAIAGIHIAEALQVPYFRAFTMPWSRTRAYPQAFAVPNKKAGGNYNYMTYVIFDKVLWTASSFQINRWRRSCLTLQPTSLDRLEQHKTPFLYNFSPNLVPKPLDWSDWIHVTGFWFLDNPETSASKPWAPPEDLVAFIQRARGNGRKVIYVGWGSITVPDPAGTTRCVVDAVRKSGVYAVLSKGWSDRLSKGKSAPGLTASAETSTALTPCEDIFQIDSAPHDWLFPQMDAACHHGGAGTLGASLRAGIPTIIKPYFGDQFFYGQQVESLGVGSCVRNLTVDALAEAITQATQNAKQIGRAEALGREIRAEKGVENAIRAIYADMDYAKSLIKRSTSLPAKSGTTTSEGLSRARVAELMARAAAEASDEESPARSRSAGVQAREAPAGIGSRIQSRSGSAHTTSDEWSVVSEAEEDDMQSVRGGRRG